MDNVYKECIPKYKKVLESLRHEFADADSSTDWAKLRVEPLLAHVNFLYRVLQSPKFARETSRLHRGVVMFHADLIYLRVNIKALKEIVAQKKLKFRTKQR